jgi:eukaryotic-like serine/threonine-protein kinase
VPKVFTVLDGRYRLDAQIGRGGMADVYRAHDLRLHRDVAVKVLREVEHERRFEVETHTLATLDHPNLVRLLDAGNDAGQLYLVMELLDGASVHELLARGPIEPAEVAEIGREAAAALDYIHERGIVHRDVKPSNLMFDHRGTLRLADFGIVRLVDGVALTATHQTIGTMAYVAPEQLRGRDVGPSADIYALGLVLLECLTGKRAFDGPPAEAGAARLTIDPNVPAALPAPWPALLQSMTTRNAELRPSAGAVRDHLSGPSTEPQSIVRTAELPAAAVAAAIATAPSPALDRFESPVETKSNGSSRPRRGPRALGVALGGVTLAAVIAAGLWVAARDDPTNAPAISPEASVPKTVAPPSETTTPTTTVPTTTATEPLPAADADERGPSNGHGNEDGNGRGNEGRGGDDDD